MRLAIPDVFSLLPGLAAIDSALRLLPQLQEFVVSMNMEKLAYENNQKKYEGDEEHHFDIVLMNLLGN